MDLTTIVTWIIFGAIVGVVARFLMPGPDPMGWVGTIVLGIIGSFVGWRAVAALLGLAFARKIGQQYARHVPRAVIAPREARDRRLRPTRTSRRRLRRLHAQLRGHS